MAKQATIKTIASGHASNTQLNFNFDALNDQFDNTLSLDGSTPNAMGADLDMNSNNVTNAADVSTDTLTVAGVKVTDATYVPNWEGPWLTTTAYVINDLVSEAGSTYICLVAHTSGTFSTDLTALNWELFAQQGSAGTGTGDMLAANNLSDVANASTSRSSLGLGTLAVENTAPIAQGGTGATTASAALLNLGALPVAGGTMTGRQTSLTIRDTNYSLTGTVIDAANGDAQYKTLAADTTFTENLSDGDSVELFIDDGAAYTVTWPMITWDDAAPTLLTTGYTRVILEQMNGVVYGSVVVGG